MAGNNHNAESEVPYTQRTAVGANNREYNCFLVCGSVFECPARYLPLKPIGKGAYGVVCSARDLVTSHKVAIKKISNAFDNAVDAKRTLREIKLLRHLNHENIVQIRDIVPPLDRTKFRDVYVVYELMDTDLHQIIRSPQPLSDDHCQYFLYQVLRGLKYIHTAHILHRDLKPSNLLVNANCDLKICDFGLARSTSSQHQEFLTEYVVTRWYRAPELLLSSSEYTAAIDVWSVGCIFAELLGRKPLFPGKDYVNQLNLITQALGSPSDSDLAFIQSEKARRYVRGLPPAQRANFQAMWPHASPKALDLLERMLVFNPAQRISIEDALAHPYLASLHDISDEPACSQPWTWDLDSEAITPDLVREMILRDVAAMHPEELQELLEPHHSHNSGAAAAAGGGGGGGTGLPAAGGAPAVQDAQQQQFQQQYPLHPQEQQYGQMQQQQQYLQPQQQPQPHAAMAQQPYTQPYAPQQPPIQQVQPVHQVQQQLHHAQQLQQQQLYVGPGAGGLPSHAGMAAGAPGPMHVVPQPSMVPGVASSPRLLAS